MFGFFRERRRRRLRAQAPPPSWDGLLREGMALYARLPAQDRAELLAHAQVLLAEKRFEGCRGLTLTEEMPLLVAAQAALLLLRRRTEYFPTVSSVLLYPDAFIATTHHPVDGGYWTVEEEARDGEAWQRDYVVLSWDTAAAGARNRDRGMNVVLHEFAHHLDAEDGEFDGVPPLTRAQTQEWTPVFEEAYERLCEDDDHDRPVALDRYGAESPAEFFAVVTETFFMRPRRLLDYAPAVYEQLAKYYGVTPAQWWEAQA
jgi:Mlc titration factor MtfA (ptsG expression regulator)